MSEFINGDCLEYMRAMPDKAYDLAIVDPPYGIGVGSMAYKDGVARVGNAVANRRDYRVNSDWDVRPDKVYFSELFRVSKKQIVWGGNYFTDYLPPSKSFIVWDKRCDDRMTNSFADCEYAWCSNGLGVARVFRYLWNGMLQQDMKNKEDRFHPTAKPIALYEWILDRYAQEGYKILDTHVGGGSSLIACENMGYEYTGFEIDEVYYKLASERIKEHTAQIRMDLPMP